MGLTGIIQKELSKRWRSTHRNRINNDEISTRILINN